jgi:(p)ppGpp synthase/HD superfamily hydrolase
MKLPPITAPLDLYRLSEQAKQAHAGVNHLYGGTLPYGFHLEMVAGTAAAHLHELHTEDEQADKTAVLAAAWFHDVLEDCRWSYTKLKNATNYQVAEIVYALTDELGKNRDERKRKTLPKIAANRFATFVKICDRIANTTHSKNTAAESTKSAGMFALYCDEYPSFKAALYQHGEYPQLWALADLAHDFN